MVYDIALWLGLVLLGVGLIHRIDAWFLREVGLGERDTTPSMRVATALRGLAGTLFSARIAGVLKVFLLDVLFQARILRDGRDRLAWVMHICIFWGFTLLLLFHALGTTVVSGYVPTLNPFLFIRNLFGLLLAAGLTLAIVRRVRRRGEIVTTAADKATLGLIAAIVVSGFLLEGLKFTSEGEFNRMVTDYTGGALTPDDTGALRAYWVERYGLVPAAPVPAHDSTLIERGREQHEAFCQSCHQQPQGAFVSYAVSRAITPVAVALDRAGMVRGFWWVHVLACCLGLAWIAFTKMFHVVSTPASLMVAEIAGTSRAAAAVATRQVIERDGCSHGGACHLSCPVRQRRFERIGDEAPYEPMTAYLGRKSAADLGSRPVSH